MWHQVVPGQVTSTSPDAARNTDHPTTAFPHLAASALPQASVLGVHKLTIAIILNAFVGVIRTQLQLVQVHWAAPRPASCATPGGAPNDQAPATMDG
jgi:hypothetical protein